MNLELAVLARSADAWDRQKAAAHLECPVEVLKELAQDENRDVRRAVAENSKIPLDVLEILAQDEDFAVRAAVAENPATPLVVLERLSRDKSPFVRQAVGWNRNTSSALLEKLAQDESGYVREAAAQNSNISEYSLVMLSKSRELYVRQIVLNRVCNSPEQFSKAFFVQVLKEGHPDFVEVFLSRVQLPLCVLQEGLRGNNRDLIQKLICQQTARETLQKLNKRGSSHDLTNSCGVVAEHSECLI